jgi:hypothetical protein
MTKHCEGNKKFVFLQNVNALSSQGSASPSTVVEVHHSPTSEEELIDDFGLLF